jgi:hypothetical protein
MAFAFVFFATGVFAADAISLGRAEARPGTSVEVPVTLKDNSGTRLGSDAAPIQAIAFRVIAEPKEAVVSITFRRTGAVQRLTPQFEHSVKTDNSVSYLVAFSSAKAKLNLRANPDDAGDEIGRVVIELAPHLAAGTVVRLSIDPLTATLSNEGGTLSEQHADGTLQLIDGAIVVP